MENWLDKETKTLLSQSPPEKIAPPDTQSFAIIVLEKATQSSDRLRRAIQRILKTSDAEVARWLKSFVPKELNIYSLRHGILAS